MSYYVIERNLELLHTLSSERIRRELDIIIKSEEGVYDMFHVGILETLIPEYKGIYWGERHYDELPVIEAVRSYGNVDSENFWFWGEITQLPSL